MKHTRPNIDTVRAGFDKSWFPYDFEGKPWQENGIPTMSCEFTDSCQPHLQLDMTSVWNQEFSDKTHYRLYKLCQHKIYIWVSTDYTKVKKPALKSISKKFLEYNGSYVEVVEKSRIVLLECLAGEPLTLIQGNVELRFDFESTGRMYYMLGSVEAEHKARLNQVKQFKLP